MENENVVTLLDENGKETDFEIIATLNVKDMEYAILLPVTGESDEAFIFRVVNEEGEYTLECVEDDEEFNLVADAYEEWLDEENVDQDE